MGHTAWAQCRALTGSSWIGEGLSKEKSNHTTAPTILHVYEHDRNAFTEGLVLDASNNVLFESTGLADVTGCCSTLRKVDMNTGRVLAYVNSSTDVFAEGITLWQDKVVQITYQLKQGFVYDQKTLQLIRTFKFETVTGQGWGLTHNGQHLIMSDGSAWIYFLDPDTFREVGRRRVFFQGQEFKVHTATV